MQTLAVGGLATRKGMLTRLIQRIPIGQLRAPQGRKLLGVVTNFSFAVMVVSIPTSSFLAPDKTERRAALSHVLKHVGIRAARRHEEG